MYILLFKVSKQCSRNNPGAIFVEYLHADQIVLYYKIDYMRTSVLQFIVKFSYLVKHMKPGFTAAPNLSYDKLSSNAA